MGFGIISDLQGSLKVKKWQKGGNVAGVARNQMEKELDEAIVSNKNYLDFEEKRKLIKLFL